VSGYGNCGTIAVSRTDAELGYGAGVQFKFASAAVRGEYERQLQQRLAGHAFARFRLDLLTTKRRLAFDALSGMRLAQKPAHRPREVAVTRTVSAGLLLHRQRGSGTEVFLVHPGGPYWANKDEGAWSVPKGLVKAQEDELAGARREFKEETGFDAEGRGSEHDLGIFPQPSGKRLHIWAIRGDCSPADLRSNLFEMEWPPKSGRMQRFPEVDRGAWFDREQALLKIAKGQRPIIEKFYAESG
jgi:predicted NUDIX family NTP pyrophosphohydrolase